MEYVRATEKRKGRALLDFGRSAAHFCCRERGATAQKEVIVFDRIF